MRVAYVDDDYAQFTAEGDEIPEVLVHTAQVTRLVRLSNEQYNQTNAASQLAQSVSRAMTRRANLGFVAEATPTTNRCWARAQWFEPPTSIDRETEVTQVNSRGQSGTRRALTPTD